MTPPEIDQLIEEGLTLYGQGDLDAALLAWEKALAADPENAQASSYVDYVRQNYDLLTGEATAGGVEERPKEGGGVVARGFFELGVATQRADGDTTPRVGLDVRGQNDREVTLILLDKLGRPGGSALLDIGG